MREGWGFWGKTDWTLDGHLRRGKPLRWEECAGSCVRGIREANRQEEGAESRWIGRGGFVVSLSQWLMGARVLAGKF